MIYLFIDTASNNLIISIVKNMEMIYCFNELNDTTLSSKIMPIIDEAFKKTNLKINDIDKIFIVNGPGSFTGIRVGVTIAKVIGWSLNIPLIVLSELELLATIASNTKYNVPIIDARRGYVYAGIYDQHLNSYLEEQHILLKELKLPDDYTLISSGDINIIKIIKKHENDLAINPHELKPNYLKKTEAEEHLND